MTQALELASDNGNHWATIAPAGQHRRQNAMSQEEAQTPQRVFVSYSHESPGHKSRVLALADRLRSEGVDCVLDQYLASPKLGWSTWMQQELAQADWVLVVCTEMYYHRAEGRAETERGSGSRFESVLIVEELRRNHMWNERFVPVLFEPEDKQWILPPLRDYSYFLVGSDEGYEELYRLLTHQPKVVPGDLGPRRKLAPLPSISEEDASLVQRRRPRKRSILGLLTLLFFGLLAVVASVLFTAWLVSRGGLGLKGATDPASQEPTGAPTPERIVAKESLEPELELGRHREPIWRLAVDANGRLLATASSDNTIRIWDLANGSLLRTIRVPFRPGEPGVLRAVALSADGETLAFGGSVGIEGTDYSPRNSVYLLDWVENSNLRRLSHFLTEVKDLAISPDGERLAVCFGGWRFLADDINGVMLFRVADGELLEQDLDYEGISYSCDFDHRGRLVTSDNRGAVRLYDMELRKIQQVQLDEHDLLDARFSPDGLYILVGTTSPLPRTYVLSGADLRPLSVLEKKEGESGLFGDWGIVDWSAQGDFFWTAGSARWAIEPSRLRYKIRRWDSQGSGTPRDWRVATSEVLDLRPLPSGGLVFGTFGGGWGTLDMEGRRRLWIGQELPVLEDFEIWTSATGNRIGLHTPDGRLQWRFSTEPPAMEPEGIDPDLGPPRLEAPHLAFELRSRSTIGFRSVEPPRLNGHELDLSSLLLPTRFSKDESERALSFAVSFDGKVLVLGTTKRLRAFDMSANLLWEQALETGATAVNVPKSGQLVVALLSDGQVQWFRLDNGELLLTLYRHADQQRWIAWTPEGHFAASEGAEDLLIWRQPRGLDALATTISAAEIPGNNDPESIRASLRVGQSVTAEPLGTNARTDRPTTDSDAPRL